MSYKLQNKLEISITLTDNSQSIDIPLDNYCALIELDITESTKYNLPVLYLKIEDAVNFFTLNQLNDGQLLAVSVITDGVVLQQSVFRIYSFKSRITGSSLSVEIDAYLNVPKYWYESSYNTYSGTSAEVLSIIAGKCGLQADIINTNDSQLWCQGNMTNSSFCTYLTRHGYKSGTSYLESGVTIGGVLKYRDVNNLTDAQYPIIQYRSVANSYTATDLDIHSSSGMNNGVCGGYGTVLRDQVTGKIYSDLTVNKNLKTLNYNSDVAAMINQSIVRFSNIRNDTSANLWAGTFQNMRYSKLYSVEASMIINSYTDIHLLSPINITCFTKDNQPDKANSGQYVVDTKAIIIRGVNYGERITACRIGRN